MRTPHALLVLAGSLLAGCVYGPPPRYRTRESVPAPLTQEEILRMTKGGLSDSVIVEKIRDVGIAERPSSEQILMLKKEGVSEEVLRAMITARVSAPAPAIAEPVTTYPYDYGYWWYSPYWFGWPYWGWQFGCYPRWYYHGYAPSPRRYRP